MAQVHVVVRDEGDYSDREWCIMAMCSTKGQALARACKYVADDFMTSNKCLDEVDIPYFIQTWIVDGVDGLSGGQDTEVTRQDVERLHPILAPVNKARTHARAERRKLLKESQTRAQREATRRQLDDKLRKGALSVDEYFSFVKAMESEGGAEETSCDQQLCVHAPSQSL